MVTGETRDPLLPDLPTMSESGFAELTLVSALGIFGPSRMSDDVVQKIYRGAVASVPQADAQIRKVGYTPQPSSPHDFATLLKHYLSIWGPIAHGIKASHN